ncbi:hypothetical protein FQR65_LT00723 [Abscondita terminalis]|nr:hypothetical protein FQR65_LT00723 [Abscondita terminalis]
MDETEKLLKTVMSLHYHNRPHIICKAANLVQEYTNDEQTNYKYDALLKALHRLMVDLPPTILLYYLTTVPFPNFDEGKTCSTFLKLMKKSRVFLLESINIVLNEYLGSAITPLVPLNDFDSNSETDNNKIESENDFDNKNYESCKEFNPRTSNILKNKPSNVVDTNGIIENVSLNLCKSLLEISSEYVMSNVQNLYELYQIQNQLAWKKLINSKENQAKCCEVIESINTKTYLLRMIDAGYVPADILRNHFRESKILLKTFDSKNCESFVPPHDTEKLKIAINTYIKD